MFKSDKSPRNVVVESRNGFMGPMERGAAWLAAKFPDRAWNLPIVRTWYANNEYFKFQTGDRIDCLGSHYGYGYDTEGWKVLGYTDDLRRYVVHDRDGNLLIICKINIEAHFKLARHTTLNSSVS